MKCNLLRIRDDYIGVPSPEASHIKEFNAIIERDDSSNKTRASKELAYVYYMLDWESPFAKYSQERRHELIKDSIFQEEWEPDEKVQAALEKYNELYQNDYTLMLESAREGARKLRQYFEDVDLTETDDKGKLKHKATDLTRNLKEIGSIIEGIRDLVDLVKQNQTQANENRGGVEVNEFSKGTQ